MNPDPVSHNKIPILSASPDTKNPQHNGWKENVRSAERQESYKWNSHNNEINAKHCYNELKERPVYEISETFK